MGHLVDVIRSLISKIANKLIILDAVKMITHINHLLLTNSSPFLNCGLIYFLATNEQFVYPLKATSFKNLLMAYVNLAHVWLEFSNF